MKNQDNVFQNKLSIHNIAIETHKKTSLTNKDLKGRSIIYAMREKKTNRRWKKKVIALMSTQNKAHKKKTI